MAHSTDISPHEMNPLVVVNLGWHSDLLLSPSYSSSLSLKRYGENKRDDDKDREMLTYFSSSQPEQIQGRLIN